MTWGDKYSAQEVDDALDQFDMDDRGFIDTAAAIELLTGKSDMDAEAAQVSERGMEGGKEGRRGRVRARRGRVRERCDREKRQIEEMNK